MAPPVRVGSHRWLSLLIVVGVVLLLGSVVGANLALRPASGKAPADSSTDWESAWECIGFADADPQISPLHPLQQGQVLEVRAQENVAVKKGDPLIVLDSRQARAQLQEAEIGVKVAEQELQQAREEVTRHQQKIAAQDSAIQAAEAELQMARSRQAEANRLFENGTTGSRADLETASGQVKRAAAGVAAEKAKREVLRSVHPEHDVTRAELQVDLRKKQAERARDALEDFTLRAPFDGTPLRVQVSVGQALGANPREPAIQFCPEGARIIRGELEQEFAARAKIGQKVVVEDYSSAGERWEGKVKRKADWYTQRRTLIPDPMQYNDVRTLECIIELKLARGQKPPHIYQRVTIKHTPDQE